VRGLNTDDAAPVLTMTRRVGASLRDYRDRGTIRTIKDRRHGKYDWRGVRARRLASHAVRDMLKAGLEFPLLAGDDGEDKQQPIWFDIVIRWEAFVSDSSLHIPFTA
jgi:hypothetical protein